MPREGLKLVEELKSLLKSILSLIRNYGLIEWDLYATTSSTCFRSVDKGQSIP
jgi:hypothetical protein